MNELFVIVVDRDRNGCADYGECEYVAGERKWVERYAQAKYGKRAEVEKMNIVSVVPKLVESLERKKTKRDEKRAIRDRELKLLEKRKKQLQADDDNENDD